jgi:hypothetical protein
MITHSIFFNTFSPLSFILEAYSSVSRNPRGQESLHPRAASIARTGHTSEMRLDVSFSVAMSGLEMHQETLVAQ